MKELDPNALAVELVKQFSKPILDGLGKLTSDIQDRLRVTLNTCFQKYITRSYDRYSKTKTLLYRDAPVNLRTFYVRTDLKIGFDTKIEESEFLSELQSNKRVVISGSAGTGKSTFCKSILLDLIEKPIGIFPIFIELRHLNSDSNTSLFDFILNTLTEIEPTFNKAQLENSLHLGKVLLIFDGFDELNNELRDKYEKEIRNISSRLNNILVLLSSRPDNRFNSWEEFHTYSVLPLDKEKSKSLIQKLDYDRQVKRKFLDVLDKELYEKHWSFASNPLLLTMMLLTYEQIAEIPNKIHLFYEQAFLTLFNKHDSLKSLYKRKSFSNLPLDEFKKLLSAFSITSYVDRKYYFSEDEIIKYLNNALRISGVDTSPHLFLNDLLDTVCMLQRDGNGYTFTHRSFQEYFTSIFLVNYSSESKFRLIDRVAFINDRDDVIPMIYGINQDALEQEWIIPRMEAMITELSVIPNSDKGKIKLLSLMYKGITTYCNDSDELSVAFRLHSKKGDHCRFIFILRKIYGDEMNAYHDAHKNKLKSPDENDAEARLIDLISSSSDEGDFELISLSDTSNIDESTEELIIKSRCYEFVEIDTNYVREKLISLRQLYSKKQSELSELLF